jgi:hypothetical protein
MRKLLIVLLVLLIALVSVVPVFADQLGPCNDNNGNPGPGNSDYAKHHIKPLATSGGMGNGGHKPGSHQGFSLCLGVHE